MTRVWEQATLQTTEGVRDSDVWEAGSFCKYVEQQLDAPMLQYVALASSVLQRHVALSNKEVAERKNSSVENIWE